MIFKLRSIAEADFKTRLFKLSEPMALVDGLCGGIVGDGSACDDDSFSSEIESFGRLCFFDKSSSAAAAMRFFLLL